MTPMLRLIAILSLVVTALVTVAVGLGYRHTANLLTYNAVDANTAYNLTDPDNGLTVGIPYVGEAWFPIGWQPGNRYVYMGPRTDTEPYPMRVTDYTGRILHQLTLPGATAGSTHIYMGYHFSPDGTLVAAITRVDVDTPNVHAMAYVVDMDGNIHAQVGLLIDVTLDIQWSPDGRYLLIREPGISGPIHLVEPEMGRVKKIGDLFYPSSGYDSAIVDWSANGEWIAVSGQGPRADRMLVIRATDGQSQLMEAIADSRYFVWSQNRADLTYITTGQMIVVYDVVRGTEQFRTSLP
ncbi:MAG: hypothetical protein AAF125_01990, partial [Chloroflexota bacterium]